MALDPVSNFAKVTVSTGYDNSATSIVLTTGHASRFPDPSIDGDFNVVWFDSTTFPDPADDPNVEIVRVTGISGDTLTVVRGQEGTTASTKNTASKTYKMVLSITEKMISDIQTMGQSSFSGWETPTETPNGSITNFSTSVSFANGLLIVTRNGQVQQSDDFTQDSDYNGYTFVTAPNTGDIIRHWYIKNSTILVGSASKWKKMVAVTGTQDGSNKVFTTPSDYISNSTTVYLNGIAQTPTTDYTETAVNQITFATGNEPISTDIIRVCYLEGAEPQGNAQTLGGSTLLEIMSALNPVGTIREFNVATNPATLLGFGTWTAFGTGRVTVAIDAGQTEFDTNGETGGAKTHTLSIAELPSHNHGGATGGQSASHSHTVTFDTSGSAGSARYTGGGSQTPISSGAASNDHTHSIPAQGSGTAHNNLQPYIVVYRWVRTA